MEYIEGEELFNYMNRKSRLSDYKIEKIFKQIILSVLYCHNILLCHRDIKLENFIIDKNENIKLIDFGFATCARKNLTKILGTAQYTAPEMIENPFYNGKKIDMWALGVVLYILKYKQYPFQGRSLSNIPKKVYDHEKHIYLSDNIYYPYECNDKIKRSLEGLICLDLDKRLSIDQLYTIWND